MNEQKNENSTKIIERLSQFVDYKGENFTQLGVKIGVSNSYFSKMVRNGGSIGIEIVSKIVKYYDELSVDWLLTGHGEMIRSGNVAPIKENNPIKSNIGIPLIPIEAMAGYGNGDVQVMNYDIQEDYIITPEFKDKGIKYLIRVSGSSMTPKYNNGDLLACRPITDISFMQWGKVYVLDTDQGPLVKRLFPCNPEDEDCLECRSDNSERYPPFKISKTSVRRVAIVVGVLRME